jgi:hypothetical protein
MVALSAASSRSTAARGRAASAILRSPRRGVREVERDRVTVWRADLIALRLRYRVMNTATAYQF